MKDLPLKGIKVLEFTHVVMGPTVGLILADLGAEVIHVEPVKGDTTRKLSGFGAGFFSFYNRNKKSLAVNLKSEKGKEIIFRLCETADVVVENFSFGTFEKLGYGYEVLKKINSKLIYCSLKGFLSGPYEKRTGMDEIVQMMGGLAYMTGKEGEPMRAGTSILDITGGMFGVIGIMAALYERTITGAGTFVRASLFETCTFMMGQFMACISNETPTIKPMPSREITWPIYQLFISSDGEQVFIGIVSDKQWTVFCNAFGWEDLQNDERLSTNNGRLKHKDYLTREISERLKKLPKADILSVCLKNDVPHASVSTPKDLLSDPHLLKGGHLFKTKLTNGQQTTLPKVPIQYGTLKTDFCTDPPAIGQHTKEILETIGLSEKEIQDLNSDGIITLVN